MKKDRYIDLSDIKEDELDKTSTFTDLMSRSERKAHEQDKKRMSKKNQESKIDDLIESISNNSEHPKEEIILDNNISTNTEKEEISTIEDNIIDDEDNKEEFELNEKPKEKSKKCGTINTIITSLFTIISIAYYIYLVIYTDNINRKRFFLIESAVILFMITMLCIKSISNHKLSKILTVFIYLTFCIYLTFNILIYFNYIK